MHKSSAAFMLKFILSRAAAVSLIVPLQLNCQTDTRTPASTAISVTACSVLKATLTSKNATGTTGRYSGDTPRIQSALSACQPGEAVLLIRNGAFDAFLSAPLILPRGVTLFIDKGVTLFASHNPQDYDLSPHSCAGPIQAQETCKPFLFAYQAAFSGVAGNGTIDGQQDSPDLHSSDLWNRRMSKAHANPASIRLPSLISSYESQNFSVVGVHLENALGTHLAIYKTIGFKASDVTIQADSKAIQGDGLLLSNSPAATITRLAVHVPGIAIDLRGSILGGTSQVRINGLHVQGGKGISLGDSIYGDTSNISISHAVIDGAKSGFTFNLIGHSGGTLHNVNLQDVCIQNVRQPLVVEQMPISSTSSVPAERNVSFGDVIVDDRGILQSSGIEANTAVHCQQVALSAENPVAPTWSIDSSAVHKGGTRSKLVVAEDGSGDFVSIQSAANALSKSGGEIDVKPGTYREVVAIRSGHVLLRGTGANPAKTLVVFNNTGPKSGGTFNSATLFVEADNVAIENMTIANDAGTGKGQAVALAVTADRADFRNIRLLGAQDTLFAAAKYCYGDYGPCAPARQYFKDCYIEGNVDFIFGDSKAVFDHCELHGIAGREVMYTAQGKHYADQQSGYIF